MKTEIQIWAENITFDLLYNKAEIPEIFFELYEEFIKDGAFPYNDDVAKFFMERLNLDDFDKAKTIVFWTSDRRNEREYAKHFNKMISEGWKILSKDSLDMLIGTEIITSPEINNIKKFKVVKTSEGKYYLIHSRSKKSGYSPYMYPPEVRFYKTI